MIRLITLGATLALALTSTACATGALDAPSSEQAVHLPPTIGVFDYQLGGASDELEAVAGPIDVVVRDATARPLAGAYSICYVNGFQTQPGDADAWLAHEDLLLHDAAGELVTDPEWPDEYVLEPSTPAQRDGILRHIGPVIDGCAERGFDAVEIDNLDTWTRFDGIDEAGAHALAAAYVDRAHGAGMAIAQKNAAEITALAHNELGFDFAVTEECGAWGECAAYTDVYGGRVLQIEYPDALAEKNMTFADVCAQPDRAPLTILRDLALAAPGVAGHLYASC
ncbi:endo alpha-1,4 polygalactosaminidase [Microbacterium sp. MAHUQ-60]|uniref:endo alpha-1,4 polygalactosaminidase n=1 Tax=unclassified Microbacterium TaxID=2609290 RepID=UPI00360CF623